MSSWILFFFSFKLIFKLSICIINVDYSICITITMNDDKFDMSILLALNLLLDIWVTLIIAIVL